MDTVIADWLSANYEESGFRDFYRFLFPFGSFEERGRQVDGMYNGIAVQISPSGEVKRFIVTDEHDAIEGMVGSSDFCIMSPVSYAGKSQRQSMARFLFAVVFDLDGIRVRDGSPVGLIDLMHQTTLDNAYAIPTPTYIVASGTGAHLYYILDEPIPLFKNVINQLGRLRRDLCTKIWNSSVTELSQNIQFESVTQGFRMVGSLAKDGETRVRAFRTGDRISIDTLNGYCAVANRVTELRRKGKTRIEDAKDKYPEWYQRRIIDGQPSGSWLAKRDLYDWWKRKIEEGAVDGHRYFCVMALAIFARKSECRLRTADEKREEKETGKKMVLPPVSLEELERDAYGLIELLDSRSIDPNRNPFTAADVAKALEAYSAEYQTFPRQSIEALSGIEVPANKRNGRPRAAHMAYLNGMNAVRRSLGEDLGAGRPSKEELVRDYAAAHPNKSNREIASDLGISRNTVNRWREKA